MDRKKQLIKEAYEKIGYGRLFKDSTENGWVKVKPGQYQNGFFERLIFNRLTESIRPVSLKGLEENNGWTKINTADDLPKFKGMYTCGQLCEDGCFIRRGTVPSAELRELFRKGGATHFKEWKPDPMPMY